MIEYLFFIGVLCSLRRNLPPLNALLAFEAASRHNNFTRAAEELKVAQPAVTRHIANLENWVGAPLFERRGSAIKLTSKGKELSELATGAFDRMEFGMRDILRTRDQELTVGSSFGIAHLWIMPRISGMRAVSNVAVNFLTSDDYNLFESPSIDFSIRFGDGEFGSNKADLLFEESYQIIASPAFIQAHPGFDPENPVLTLDPELLFDHGDPYNVGWMTWEQWCGYKGASYPGDLKLTKIYAYPTMLDMVCAGEGVGIGMAGFADDLTASGTLTCVGAPIGRPNFGYYLVYRKEQLDKLSFRRLRSYLVGSD